MISSAIILWVLTIVDFVSDILAVTNFTADTNDYVDKFDKIENSVEVFPLPYSNHSFSNTTCMDISLESDCIIIFKAGFCDDSQGCDQTCGNCGSENINVTALPWSSDSIFGESMINGYNSLSKEDQSYYCDVPLLYEHNSIEAAARANVVAGWVFIALSVCAFCMYWMTLGEYIAGDEKQADLNYAVAVGKILIQMVEDVPQLIILTYMCVSIYQGDGFDCHSKFYDWGKNPTLWENGGSDALKAQFSPEEPLLDIMYSSYWISFSFLCSLAVLVANNINSFYHTADSLFCDANMARPPEWKAVGMVPIIACLCVAIPVFGFFYFVGAIFLEKEDSDGGTSLLLLFIISCVCWCCACCGFFYFVTNPDAKYE